MHRRAASTFPFAHNTSAVIKSSARPCAIRASTSAVAGTITTASATAPSATCASPAAANISRITSSPVSPENVLAPTNFSAAELITTTTRAPSFLRSRTKIAAL